MLHVPASQLPQVPEHPSLPHCRPVHEGVHEAPQRPVCVLHTNMPGHMPQLPPQPSGPHMRPAQSGTHWHAAAAEHAWGAAQAPQLPPHPSGPHSFPAQLGRHRHTPAAVQAWPIAQVPHVPPQPSGPHVPAHCRTHWHVPWAVQL